MKKNLRDPQIICGSLALVLFCKGQKCFSADLSAENGGTVFSVLSLFFREQFLRDVQTEAGVEGFIDVVEFRRLIRSVYGNVEVHGGFFKDFPKSCLPFVSGESLRLLLEVAGYELGHIHINVGDGAPGIVLTDKDFRRFFLCPVAGAEIRGGKQVGGRNEGEEQICHGNQIGSENRGATFVSFIEAFRCLVILKKFLQAEAFFNQIIEGRKGKDQPIFPGLYEAGAAAAVPPYIVGDGDGCFFSGSDGGFLYNAFDKCFCSPVIGGNDATGTVDNAVIIVHCAEGNVKPTAVNGGSAYGSVPKYLTGGRESFFLGSGGISLPDV